MNNNEQLIHDVASLYKLIYSNKGVHRNTLKKKALKSKIPSQTRFSKAMQYLLSNNLVTVEKDEITLSNSKITVALLQKKDNDYILVMPHSKNHFSISKSVASGYQVGDLLNVIQDPNLNTITILGKSSKEKNNNSIKENKSEKTTTLAEKLLGRVIKLSHDELIFIPNKKSLPARRIPILNNKEELSAFQDKLCIMQLLQTDAPLLGGYITEIKGDAGNPIHEYDAIAESYGAIMSWEGEKIQSEIDNIPNTVDVNSLPLITVEQANTLQKGHVVDLRHIPFVTVDPATCKDMDDAIFSTFDENGNIVCYTAVANVTKYFSLYSEIGRRYTKGAFTIYAPNKAYNILPTKLSTGVCSLNPNEPRLAFVIKTTIDRKNGKVLNSQIYDALIESKQKYSYEQAQEITDKLKQDISKQDLFQKVQNGEPLTLEEQTLMNFYAGETIKTGFENRKMIRFIANNEREVVFNDDHESIEDIVAIPHLYYHEVIEAFMITANEATAKYTRDKNIPSIYRVHDEPKQNKVTRANEFFKILGIDFDGDLSASGTRALIELIKETPSEETINNFLIKMQSRAVYSDSLYTSNITQDESGWMGERISHYALQSPHYSHSPAPIRRLSDYIVHFNILADIHGTKPISLDAIKKLVEISNTRQLDVDQAEKDFEDVSSAIYCEKHIGEQLSGRISKMRYASPSEGYDDEIIVIVKNQEKGINVEIPLSQIVGRIANECSLSAEHCAVYNKKGEIVLTLCKPINFIIEKADRKSMIVVGKTNKEMIKKAEQNATDYRQYHTHLDTLVNARQHNQNKHNRQKRIQNNKSHNTYSNHDEFEA